MNVYQLMCLILFDFQGEMLDLIVLVPDHCLSFYFSYHMLLSFTSFWLSMSQMEVLCDCCLSWLPGHGCSKLTTSLVKVSLNFQNLISQICQYFC